MISVFFDDVILNRLIDVCRCVYLIFVVFGFIIFIICICFCCDEIIVVVSIFGCSCIYVVKGGNGIGCIDVMFFKLYILI